MSIQLDKHLLLFECCQLTKGHSRTLVHDSQRNVIAFVDNTIYEIFNLYSRALKIGEILTKYAPSLRESIIEYLEYMLENEYIFYCETNEVPFFAKMDLQWDDPSIITNCIIDFNEEPKELRHYFKVFEELDFLGCENLQIRDYHGLSLTFLRQLLNKIRTTAIHKIELIIKSNNKLENVQGFLEEYPRVRQLVVHSSSVDAAIPTKTDQTLITTEQQISDENCCGIISTKYFNLDWNHYLESNNHNTCLNRKLSIDKYGTIKNCPSLRTGYGHISKTSIMDIVNTEEFRAIWNIKKDDVSDCSVCEFRHICTDCRAFLEKDLSLKKPAKCNYNPYKAVWE